MASKFYQVDYAEVNGSEIINMGIFNIQADGNISKDLLKERARQYLKDPAANIVISNITKLTRAEFESLTQKNA